MAAQQIADLYGSVGFRVDQKSWATLDRFESRLDNIRRKLSMALTGKLRGGAGAGGGGTSGGGGRGRSSGARGSLSMTGSALSNIHTVGMTITGGALTLAGKAIVNTTAKYDGLRSSLLAATGDAASAEKEFQFLEETSRRLGQVTSEIAKPFVNFSVSAREMGVSAEDTRTIYTQMAEASRGLNLSADDTAGIFRALSQMFSKATVQSEELKGQLGERLPGAYAVAARVMGLTTQEMGKQLKEGKILATDLIPKLSKEYQRLVKSSGALQLALKSTSFMVGRMSEEWNRMLDRLGRGEAGDGLRKAMLGFTEFFKGFGEEGSAASHFFGFLGRLLHGFIDILAAASQGFDQFFKAFGPEGIAILTAFGLALLLLLPKVNKVGKALKFLSAITIGIAILEDLIAFFKGEESLTGQVAKWLFGTDGRDALFKSVQDFFSDLEKAWERREFKTFLSKIFGGSNSDETFVDLLTRNLAESFPGSGFELKHKGRLKQRELQVNRNRDDFLSKEASARSNDLRSTSTTIHIGAVELPSVMDGPTFMEDLNRFIDPYVPLRSD